MTICVYCHQKNIQKHKKMLKIAGFSSADFFKWSYCIVFFKDLFIFNYVCLFVSAHKYSTHETQKSGLGPRELELWMGSWNQTLVL